MATEGSDHSDLESDPTVRGLRVRAVMFGRYRLERILGRGGMGVVWLARDEDLGREVALKFLPELILHDRAVVEDLKKETRRSLQLTHPNIVRIHDFVQDGHSACISMEYVDGETLSSLRCEQPNQVFETAVLEPYVRELCDALHYAHTRAKIVHRDLKPANLMVNSRGELKVTDFGIARSLTDSVSMISMRTSGTLVYMSPQQLDGERSSPQDDIYSLGATVYELLTGKPPFYSGNIDRQIHEKVPVSMAARRAELNVRSTGAVPGPWEETVASCLAKDPAQRPQTAADVARRLGFRPAYTHASPPSEPACESPAAETSAMFSQRKRRLVAAGAALLLVSVALASWRFGVEQPGRRADAPRTASFQPAARDAKSDADARPKVVTPQQAQTHGGADSRARIRDLDSLLSQNEPLESGTAIDISSPLPLFDYNSDTLTGSAMGELRKLATLIKRNPAARFIIEGSSDARTSAMVTQARADSAARYLVEHLGISRVQVQAKEYHTSSMIEQLPTYNPRDPASHRLIVTMIDAEKR